MGIVKTDYSHSSYAAGGVDTGDYTIGFLRGDGDLEVLAAIHGGNLADDQISMDGIRAIRDVVVHLFQSFLGKHDYEVIAVNRTDLPDVVVIEADTDTLKSELENLRDKYLATEFSDGGKTSKALNKIMDAIDTLGVNK